jgi:excinuclease ABC subunit C
MPRTATKEQTRLDPRRKLPTVPRKPGVYIMKGPREKVLYVGKAKDLRARLKSYFQKSADLDNRKRAMMGQVQDISWLVTDGELEALALEANLIKQMRPRFNVILRDDKNYPYIKITVNEEWPRLEVVRRVSRDGALYFGPYVPAGGMWEALGVIRRNFGVRPCRYRLEKPMRPCIQHQMGKCPAPCAGKISHEDYRKLVDEVILFLKGRNRELLEALEARMRQLSGELRFEEAARLRDRVHALRRAWETQKVISPELGDLDVVGYVREGDGAQVQVFFVRNGIMVGAKDFLLKDVAGMAGGELLHNFLLNFYAAKEVLPPAELVLAELPEDTEALSAWLKERRGGKVALSVPRRGKKRALLRLAEKNARHAARSRRGPESTLQELARRLGLSAPPRSIGAFDVSNLSGTEAVGAFVYWEDGSFWKDRYRHLRIHGVQGVDDYAMIEETVRRVLDDMEPPPDLVVIDGGRAHLEAASRAAEVLPALPVLVAVAKKPDRAFPSSPGPPLDLEDRSPSSLLLVKIRDEVHRFAISFHKKLRGRRALASPLETVPGIGKKRRLELLKHFGNMEAMRKASLEELARVPGMNRRAAAALKKALAGEEEGE